jgi:hemerythrin-like domain-containing protein
MYITQALTDHHQVLRQLYQASQSDPSRFEEFVRHLIVHHTMEERYFYDLMEQISEGRHDALEAVNEHHIIELIIKDAEGFPQEHDKFTIKIEGLGEYTSHHLDEEENEIFPTAPQLFTDDEANTLGDLFNEAKDRMLGIDLPAVPQGIPGAVSDSSRTTSRGLGIGSLKR